MNEEPRTDSQRDRTKPELSETATPSAADSGWKLVGGVTALVVVAVVALWALWGFRWPPTSEVVDRPEPAAEEGLAPYGRQDP